MSIAEAFQEPVPSPDMAPAMSLLCPLSELQGLRQQRELPIANAYDLAMNRGSDSFVSLFVRSAPWRPAQ
jgi:hypothetical protein